MLTNIYKLLLAGSAMALVMWSAQCFAQEGTYYPGTNCIAKVSSQSYSAFAGTIAGPNAGSSNIMCPGPKTILNSDDFLGQVNTYDYDASGGQTCTFRVGHKGNDGVYDTDTDTTLFGHDILTGTVSTDLDYDAVFSIDCEAPATSGVPFKVKNYYIYEYAAD